MTKYMRNQKRLKPHKIQPSNGPRRGRPFNNGFTPSDIVSCVLELKRRELGLIPGATRKAVKYVELVFVDIGGYDAERTIYRDWRIGRNLAQILSESDLLEVVKPYIVQDKDK
jgi:hypothetical protein